MNSTSTNRTSWSDKQITPLEAISLGTVTMSMILVGLLGNAVVIVAVIRSLID